MATYNHSIKNCDCGCSRYETVVDGLTEIFDCAECGAHIAELVLGPGD